MSEPTVLWIKKSSGITAAQAKRIEKTTGHVVVFVNSHDDVRAASNDLLPIERHLLAAALQALDEDTWGSARTAFNSHFAWYLRRDVGLPVKVKEKKT